MDRIKLNGKREKKGQVLMKGNQKYGLNNMWWVKLGRGVLWRMM